MNFKEWYLQERYKGAERLFNQKNPNVPDYVRKELYNGYVAPGISKFIKDQNPSTSSGSGTRSPLNSNLSDKWLDSLHWTKKPVILSWQNSEGVTPASYTPRTQGYFIRRRFGFKIEPTIRNDAARMTTQKNLMASQEKNEPVIVQYTMEGYDLLEGWHRTMNYLLQGAPPDQLEALKNGQVHDLNFSKWKPVKIWAYVGTGPEVQAALAGTGEI